MTATVEQHVALGEEVRTSVELIKAGLGHLQRMGAANDFYHLPMLLLASGFERLMKTIICLHTLRETGEYPSPSDPILGGGSKGHDLARLLDKITTDCFNPAYVESVPAARKDIEYLRRDPRLRKLVEMLSNFGQAARYHDLNVVLGRPSDIASPEREWKKLELDVLKGDSEWQDELADPAKWDMLYKMIASNLVARLERFARALSRLFTLGGLGHEAKRHTGTIAPFLFLRDEDLGKQTYS